MKKRVFFDLDGTLAEWKTFTGLSIEKLYGILTSPGYYFNLRPNTSVIEAANILQKKGYDIYIITCYINEQARRDKILWLKKWMPFIPIDHVIFVPDGENKSIYVWNREPTDTLVDDLSKNLHEWHGKTVKIMNGLNGTHGTYKGVKAYIGDYREIAEKIISA